MDRIVDIALRNRFLVLAGTVLAAGLGVWSMFRLPIDAVPDVTPNQVMVLTQAPGIGPVEVEQFVTVPVETAMSGLPGITAIRRLPRRAGRDPQAVDGAGLGGGDRGRGARRRAGGPDEDAAGLGHAARDRPPRWTTRLRSI